MPFFFYTQWSYSLQPLGWFLTRHISLTSHAYGVSCFTNSATICYVPFCKQSNELMHWQTNVCLCMEVMYCSQCILSV